MATLEQVKADLDRGGGVPQRHHRPALAERDHHVVHWTEFSRGGRRAALEVPDLLVGDVREFFRKLR